MVWRGGTPLMWLTRIALPTLVWSCRGDVSGLAPPPPPPCASTAEAPVIAATPVHQVNFLDDLLWVSSGNQVFYTSAPPDTGGFALKVFDVASQTVRVVDGRNAYYHSLTLSPDAQSVYYTAALELLNPSYSIYRRALAGGSPELLVDSVGSRFLVSPDGATLAYAPERNQDSIVLFDIATKVRTFVARGYPAAFSPDGRRLLVSTLPAGELASYFVITLGSGATEPVPGLTGAIIVRWDADGIRALVETDSVYPYRHLYIRNVTTNTTTRMACAVPVWVWRWGLSPDGEHVAYWEERAGYSERQAILHWAGAQADIVLRRSNSVVGTIALAPDGARIAYISGSQILISQLPVAAFPPVGAAKTP
jgi:hypothetical protein